MQRRSSLSVVTIGVSGLLHSRISSLPTSVRAAARSGVPVGTYVQKLAEFGNPSNTDEPTWPPRHPASVDVTVAIGLTRYRVESIVLFERRFGDPVDEIWTWPYGSPGRQRKMLSNRTVSRQKLARSG